jgi:hypothetical protein
VVPTPITSLFPGETTVSLHRDLLNTGRSVLADLQAQAVAYRVKPGYEWSDPARYVGLTARVSSVEEAEEPSMYERHRKTHRIVSVARQQTVQGLTVAPPFTLDGIFEIDGVDWVVTGVLHEDPAFGRYRVERVLVADTTGA